MKEQSYSKVVEAEDVDRTMEELFAKHSEKEGWVAKQPKVESAAGNKVKVIVNFSKKDN